MYEVQKIQDMWKGSWGPQNFTHRMIFLISQTAPILENLVCPSPSLFFSSIFMLTATPHILQKLDPKELKVVFDKAKKPKEDPAVEIDRDIYSVYWSGVFKDIEPPAVDHPDEYM